MVLQRVQRRVNLFWEHCLLSLLFLFIFYSAGPNYGRFVRADQPVSTPKAHPVSGSVSRKIFRKANLFSRSSSSSPASPQSSPQSSAPAHSSTGSQNMAPPFSTLLKEPLMKRIMDSREILVNASLKDLTPEQTKYIEALKIPDASQVQFYSFFAAMRVNASLGMTYRTLTDYALYSQIIPYVTRTVFSEKDKTLLIAGGIWGFGIQSTIRFDEKSDRWLHYAVIDGHFKGMNGDIFFEPLGEKGTAVYLRGEVFGYGWPPRFVIERGAEIVFSYAAKEMRNWIESQKKEGQGANHGPQKRAGNGQESSKSGSTENGSSKDSSTKNSSKGGEDAVPRPRSRL